MNSLLASNKFRTAVAVALCLYVAWYGEHLRLYEHPYFGSIHPGPGIGGTVILLIGIWRKWPLFRGFAMLRLGFGVLGYALVIFQNQALWPQALLLGVGTAVLLYILVQMTPGERLFRPSPARLGFR